MREDVPAEEDKVYVVAFQYKMSKSKKSKIKDLRCFITTRRHIKSALKSSFYVYCIYHKDFIFIYYYIN